MKTVTRLWSFRLFRSVSGLAILAAPVCALFFGLIPTEGANTPFAAVQTLGSAVVGAGLSVFPYQSEQQLPFSLALGDISMVTLDEGAEGLMLPSKLSYYMAAGSAILGVCSGENDLRDTIECADCGICVPPNHPQQLAAAITRMVDNPDLLSRYRTNARKSAESTYSRKICIQNLKELLQKTGYRLPA